MTWARAAPGGRARQGENVKEAMAEWFQVNLYEQIELMSSMVRSNLNKLSSAPSWARSSRSTCTRARRRRRWSRRTRCLAQRLQVGAAAALLLVEARRWHEDVARRHSDALIEYGYEYLGNDLAPRDHAAHRSVLAHAHGRYGLKLGGAPAGPAGTGKTESTKDLAKAMAIQCVVFNCSDQLDYKMMGKFFRGSRSRARGRASTSSTASTSRCSRSSRSRCSCMQQRASAAGERTINFEGIEIGCSITNVFITMNPGYAGRTELPDNLKALFRPVAMMVPDYALIGEIILFAEGFATGQGAPRARWSRCTSSARSSSRSRTTTTTACARSSRCS